MTELVPFSRDSKSLFKKNGYLSKNIVDLLESKPKQGTPHGRNCFKIWAKISSNEREGASVITPSFIYENTVTLIAVYDKSDQSNISDKEIERRLNETLE